MTTMIMTWDSKSSESIKQLYKEREKKIRVGTTVRPKFYIKFCDGSSHSPGRIETIAHETFSYYIVNFNNYEIVEF